MELDFSQADARIVAALSGDENYAQLFAPGADMHEIRGKAVFGEGVYNSNPGKYRQDIKPINHGSNYGLGKTKLAANIGVPVHVAGEMLSADAKFYAKVTSWKKRVVDWASRHRYITNDWGRWMPVDPGREYTQSPALLGQSGTRELMLDALDRMLHHDIRLILWCKATVHDAIIWSLPKKDAPQIVDTLKSLMYCEWEPRDGTGQKIKFEVTGGTPGANWAEASH